MGSGARLLFGVTGIVLNHRSVLKVLIEKTVQRTIQVAIPAGRARLAPANAFLAATRASATGARKTAPK